MNKTGVDMTIFSPRSTRSASISAVKQTVPVETIMKTVGWSHDSIIIKPIVVDYSYSNSLLQYFDS